VVKKCFRRGGKEGQHVEEGRPCTWRREMQNRACDSVWCRLLFDDGKEVRVRHRAFTIGRDRSNDHVNIDPRLSSSHCYITAPAGFDAPPTLTDTSTNGTFVKGEKLLKSSIHLQWGERIEVVKDNLSLCFVLAKDVAKPPGSYVDEWEESLNKARERLSHLENVMGIAGPQARVLFEQASGDESRLEDLVSRNLEKCSAETAVLSYRSSDKSKWSCVVCQEAPENAQGGNGGNGQSTGSAPLSVRFDCGHRLCFECATGMLKARKDESPDAVNLLDCACERLEGCGGALFLSETSRVVQGLKGTPATPATVAHCGTSAACDTPAHEHDCPAKEHEVPAKKRRDTRSSAPSPSHSYVPGD
jgi:hypothetical protein